MDLLNVPLLFYNFNGFYFLIHILNKKLNMSKQKRILKYCTCDTGNVCCYELVMLEVLLV